MTIATIFVLVLARCFPFLCQRQKTTLEKGFSAMEWQRRLYWRSPWCFVEAVLTILACTSVDLSFGGWFADETNSNLMVGVAGAQSYLTQYLVEVFDMGTSSIKK